MGPGIAALGGILSFVSYNNAKPGESYTIYTGIIVIGIIDAICGIYYLIRPSQLFLKINNPIAALPIECFGELIIIFGLIIKL